MWTKERKIQEEMEMASATSVFAPGLSIKGDIEATSDIRIEGDICGNVVTKKKVIVGVSGKVKGDIHASEICVMGEVLGDLFIQGLARFTAEAKMKGVVYSEKIGIEAGADVEVTVSKIKKGTTPEASTAVPKSKNRDATASVGELMKMD